MKKQNKKKEAAAHTHTPDEPATHTHTHTLANSTREALMQKRQKQQSTCRIDNARRFASVCGVCVSASVGVR